MSDVPTRAVDGKQPAPPADPLEAAKPAAIGPPKAGPPTASASDAPSAPAREADGSANVNITSLSEDELDWRENQSRGPGQAARNDLLLLGSYALAAVVAVALLIFLYRYLF
jgi:hypothetical protein